MKMSPAEEAQYAYDYSLNGEDLGEATQREYDKIQTAYARAAHDGTGVPRKFDDHGLMLVSLRSTTTSPSSPLSQP
jgi:hypothetical protein